MRFCSGFPGLQADGVRGGLFIRAVDQGRRAPCDDAPGFLGRGIVAVDLESSGLFLHGFPQFLPRGCADHDAPALQYEIHRKDLGVTVDDKSESSHDGRGQQLPALVVIDLAAPSASFMCTDTAVGASVALQLA